MPFRAEYFPPPQWLFQILLDLQKTLQQLKPSLQFSITVRCSLIKNFSRAIEINTKSIFAAEFLGVLHSKGELGEHNICKNTPLPVSPVETCPWKQPHLGLACSTQRLFHCRLFYFVRNHLGRGAQLQGDGLGEMQEPGWDCSGFYGFFFPLPDGSLGDFSSLWNEMQKA